MSSTGHLSELDLLRSQVADLSRELAEQDRVLQDSRRQSALLRAIVEGTAAETGEEFFASLVTHLTSVLHIKYAVIGEVQGDRIKKIRTLAVSAGGTLVDNFEYELAHTPCATALTQTFACFDRDIQATFPQFQRLVDLGVESYCGVPLRTKSGAVVGLLVVMDTKPLEHSDYLQSLLGVFAPRIAAELEREKAEQERARALAELCNVIETVPDIMFTLDTHGNMVKWNSRLETVTGYSPEELLNMPALAFVPPEEHIPTAAAIERAFTEGYAELEGHLLTKEYRPIPYHWTGALLKNPHGEPIGITGIGRDVSDRKSAEEALRRSEERLALAVEGSNDILWDAHRLPGEPWYAPQTQIWWSPCIRELLGLQESDSFETLEQWAARLHPDDKDRVFGQLAAHIEQRVPYDVEYRLRTNTGDYRWIRGRGQALWDEQGEPRRMSGSCQDITERKGVEEALRVSEERWHLAVRGSNDGIWDWDIQSGTVFFPPRWKAMRGFGEHEIPNHVEEWQRRIHPDDLGRVLQSLDAYMAKQTPDFCEEYRTQRKDGSYMWILDRGLALWAEDGTPLRMVGSESDITEHKQALLRLAEQESLLRSILDTEPECVNRVADDGTILQMNKAGLCFIEADSFEQVAGRSVFDLVAPEFLERYRRMHEAVIRGASQPLEFQIVGLKGTRRWMETHAVPLRNPIDHRTEHLAITRDITHRKRTETALRESEERYRTLVDLSPNGVLVYSNGKKVYVNQAACRIMGAASPEQLLENPTFHFSHPDDHASIHASIAQILATGEPVRRVERKYQRLDGTEIFVEVDAGRIMWRGEPAIQVIFADITEHKQAEEALRKSEAQFRALAESTTDWMWEIDEQGCFTYCSPKIRDLLGYEPNEALGKTPFDFMPEEEARRVAGLFGPIAAARKPFAGIENMNRHKDGRLVILECRGTPVIDDNGLFRGYRGFDQDITERKRVEESLLQSWLFLQSFVEHIPAAVAMLDRDLRYVVVSQRWYQDYQLSEPSIIGLHHYDVFPEIRGMEHWQAIHRRCLAGEILRSNEDHFVRKDGKEDWLRWEIRPWMDANGSIGGIIIYTEVITDRKQAEEALRASEERLRLSLEAANQGIYDLNVQTGEALVSSGYVTMLDYDPATFRETTAAWVERLHPDDRERVADYYRDYVAGKIPEYRVEFRQRTRGGGWRWILSLGRIVERDARGEPLRMLGTHTDITERKQAEEALREREVALTRFKATLDQTHDCVFIFAPDTLRFIYCNRGAVEQVGYSEAELFTMTPFDIKPKFTEQSFREMLRALQDGQRGSHVFETVHRHKDGHDVSVEVSLQLVREEGQEGRFVAVVRDITERKRVEEDLRTSEERLQFVARATNDAIWDWDLNTDETKWNQGLQTLFGYKPEDVEPAAAFWHNQLHPDDRERVIAGIHAAIDRGEHSWSDEYRFLRADGSDAYIFDRGYILYDSAEKPKRMIGSMQDITARKQAEEALRFSEERFNLAVRGSNTGIWDWDLRTNKTYFSPLWKSMLGYEEHELKGEFFEWEERLHPDDRERSSATVRAYLEGVTPQYELEHRLRHKNGSYRWILARGVSICDTEGKPCRMAGSHIDITEQKQTEEALAQNARQLRTVLNALPVGVWLTDRSGKPLLANPVAKQIWSNIKQIGVQTEDNRTSWWETVGSADQLHRWALSHTLATGHSSQHETLVFECLDGEKKIIRNSTVPVLDEAGVAQGAIVLNEDITMLHRAQEALQLTQFSVDRAVEGFFWISPDARIVHVNEAACRMLEYTSEELTAMTVHDIDPNFSPEAWQAHWEELREKGSLTFESKHWTKIGRVLETEIIVKFLLYEEKEYSCVIMRDVGVRKRTEAALRASEERYRVLYNESPTMYFTLATDGTVRSVNRFGAEQLGYQAEELIGHSVLGLFYEGDRATVVVSLSECVAAPETTRHWEFRKIRKDGSVIWVQETARVCGSSTGETVVLVACEDITERKLAEHESRERIQQALKLERMLLELARLDNRVLTFSEGCQALTEIVAETLQIERVGLWLLSEDRTELVCHGLYNDSQTSHSSGNRLMAASYPRYLSALEDSLVMAVSDALVDPRTSELAEGYLLPLGITSMMEIPIRRHGQFIGVVRCEHVGLPREWSYEVQGFGASVAELVARMMEAAERKRMEAALRASEDQFNKAFTEAAIGMGLAAPDGRWLQVNQALCEIIGYSQEELEATTFQAITHPDDRLLDLAYVDQLLTGEIRTYEVEKRYLHKQGHVVWILLSVSLVRTADGAPAHFVKQIQDITERKRIEGALRQRECELQAALEERERISQDLHDGILQSLFAVGLALESTKLTMSPGSRKTSGASLDPAIRQLNLVMGEIRSFIAGLGSDLLKGKDISAVLHQMLAPLTENQPTRVRLAVEGRAAKALSTEQALHLLRVIQESVSNCIKHGHAREARVSLKLLKQGVRLSIRDNGRGFNPDTAKGAGHGLSNMAARAQKIGGRFSVSSKPNEGTSIVLDLPKVDVNVTR